MDKKGTLNWFVVGFISVFLAMSVVTMVLWPSLGRAQGGDAENPNAASLESRDTSADDSSTNGPEAQMPAVPLADNGGSRSNWDALVPADPSSQASESDELNQPGAAGDRMGYTSPLIIPAADFSSDGVDPDGFFFNFTGYVDGNGTACLKAPAYLPNGATVVSVYASLYDNTTSDIFLDLRRVNITNGESDVMGSLATSSSGTSLQQRYDTSIDYPVISYPTYAYYVTTCLNSVDHRLYSVRIYYTGP